MTADEFRRIALSMPNATESAHMQHPDFRVREKIFATLGYPNTQSAMVKLMPEQQKEFISKQPNVFSPAKGAWGRRGSTIISLRQIDEPTAVEAVQMAWQNIAT
jgi:predicted DNA-binding protein (MmcQ/YjbR family)